ncbi:hypothetical protein [Rhizobium sp. RCC_161_2]|uniref:hypothetical protein n=1 Tax=Rhizobium sp. RCC_161_2 TaxID=3239219 RepID=UPI0035265ECA
MAGFQVLDATVFHTNCESKMTVPTVKFRIQFRNSMTFDRAAKHVPYQKRLGTSHFYALPTLVPPPAPSTAMT